MLLLWIIYVISVLFCYAFMHICLLMHCGHLLGKSWPFGSRLWCLIVKLSLSHWYPGSGVELDFIDSWYLPSFLLYFCSLARHGLVSAKCLMRLNDTMVHLLWPLEMDPFCFYFWDWHKIYCCTVCVCWKKENLTPAHISKVTLNMSSHSAQHCRYQT